MSQEEYLQQYINIHTAFLNVIDAATYINNYFPKFAKNHFDSKQNELDQFWEDLHKKDPETWSVVNTLYEELRQGKEPNVSGLSEKALESWLHLLEDGANYQSSVAFTHEMILINMITKFNEFLKDTLKIAFSIDPQTKDSWKELSDEEQETKIFHLVEDDIKEAAKTIRKIFGLDLKVEENWRDFAEYTYRRHVYIHNRGFPSKKYKDRTGYRGQDIKLLIDKNYVDTGLSLFKKYSDQIEEFFIEKHLGMVNITKKSNIVKIDLTKGDGEIIILDENSDD